MKKIIFLLVSAFVLCTFNVYATNNEERSTSTKPESSSQVYRFSLNHYTGTISQHGCTRTIRVRLNYPQDADVWATVFVYIDNKRVASEIFKISKGNTESHPDMIKTTLGDYGKTYTLEVQ